jgi:hypothetical protein
MKRQREKAAQAWPEKAAAKRQQSSLQATVTVQQPAQGLAESAASPIAPVTVPAESPDQLPKILQAILERLDNLEKGKKSAGDGFKTTTSPEEANILV